MARPIRFDEAATAAIRIRVTPQQRAALLQVARENNARVADVIRDAVDDYVADYSDANVFRGPKRSPLA